EVLPSLGEDDVQLTTVAGLKPQLRARASEPPATAALKGDARMARVLARALRDRERPLRDDLVVALDGHVLRLPPADSARIVQRARRRLDRGGRGAGRRSGRAARPSGARATTTPAPAAGRVRSRSRGRRPRRRGARAGELHDRSRGRRALRRWRGAERGWRRR